MNSNANVERNPFIAPQAELEDSGELADSEFKLNLFSSEGRIGRIRYLAYSMGLFIPTMLIGGVLSAITTSGIPMILAYVAVLYFNIMLAIKRSHDFNASGWASLLVLLPLINFLFLFVPGTDGPNRFGNKTAPNGSAWIVVVVAVVGIFVIGILAAIAIPAYQQYVQRAQMSQKH
ncbi:MAG: DUF805 domain-containing protein [Azonexus sp.]